nr:hypothetical protein [Tanacetum cinerariifolium]
MIACSISGKRQAPEKVTSVDLFYLRTMDRGTANIPYLLAKYLFRHAEGRKSGARLLGGHVIGHLAAHFGLVDDQGLRGFSVVVRPKRQQAAAAGAPGAAKDAHAADEGAQAVPAPGIERLKEEVRELQKSVVGLRGVVESSITKQTRVSSWMISCMTQLMDASGRTYQAFDSTLFGSSRVPYQRRVTPKTGDANTSTASHTDDQPDP